uniref:Uncharacterized protein n=1 Tax=Rhizophora mucronata TaxID=61149 RepID=A0A2P2PVI8_RHIMU
MEWNILHMSLIITLLKIKFSSKLIYL